VAPAPWPPVGVEIRWPDRFVAARHAAAAGRDGGSHGELQPSGVLTPRVRGGGNRRAREQVRKKRHGRAREQVTTDEEEMRALSAQVWPRRWIGEMGAGLLGRPVAAWCRAVASERDQSLLRPFFEGRNMYILVTGPDYTYFSHMHRRGTAIFTWKFLPRHCHRLDVEAL
jgi:hypothetical protein